MTEVLMAEPADGYRVVFALAEMDPALLRQYPVSYGPWVRVTLGVNVEVPFMAVAASCDSGAQSAVLPGM